MTGRSGQDARDLASLATAAFNDGRLEEAADHASKLLAIRPGNKRALRILSRTRADSGLIEEWRTVAAISQGDPEPWLQMARIAATVNLHDEAVRAAAQVLALQPDHLEAIRLQWIAALELRDWPACAATWQRAYKLDPSRSFELLKQVDWDRHLDVLSSLDLHGDADIKRRIDVLLRDQRRSWLADAFEAELAGNAPEAAAHFSRLARVVPGQTDFEDGLRRALSRLRIALDAGGDTAAQTNAARALIAFEPANPRALEILTDAASRASLWIEAVDWIEKRLKNTPADADLLIAYAEALLECRRYGAAVDAWLRARACQAESERREQFGARLRELLFGRLNSEPPGEDWSEVWELHDAAARLDLVEQRMTAGLLRVMLAAINDEHDKRATHLSKLCRLYLDRAPRDPRVTRIMARSLMREMHYADALTVWQQIYQEAPNLEASLHIARCAKHLKLTAVGRDHAERVLAQDGRHEEARRLLSHFNAIP